MSFNRFTYWLISFFMGLFFLLAGTMTALIPWVPAIRERLIHLLTEQTLLLSLFGVALVAIGAVLVANIIILTKHRYYQIRSDEHPVSIDENLIQQYLDSYWEELFPERSVHSHIVLKKNKIHLYCDLPEVAQDEQLRILERIELDLEKIFDKTLGYKDEFYISASFQ